ncbi:MAG: hypothetical protein RL071_5145 [Pseudomonadota bacterium]
MLPTAALDPLLRRLRQGPASGRALHEALGCSADALGRLLRAHPDRVVRLGARKTSTYALIRSIPGVLSPVPVFAWGPTRTAPDAPLLHLLPIEPAGFAALPADGGPAVAYPDLPWFLHDLRPQGFLGRRLPRALGLRELPADVREWGADQVLRYLCTAGISAPGAFVLGEAMRVAAMGAAPPPACADTEAGVIDLLAAQLAAGVEDPPPGSSAAGEQPKALAALRAADGLHELIVKYSPPVSEPVGRRVADLLVAEQLAGAVVEAWRPGWAARATVQLAHGRAWLLSRRFDRDPRGGRRGCVSLEAADAEFAEHPPGASIRWSLSARALGRAGRLGPAAVAQVCLLEAFGHGIGNTDMHLGNLALGLNGVEIDGVMPIYDMLPMAWMPQHNERPPLRPPRPAPADLSAEVEQVAPAVADFWARLAADARVSDEVRAAAGALCRAAPG